MKKFCLYCLLLSIYLCSSAQSFEKTRYGMKTTIRDMNIEIQFYSNDIVRVLKSPVGKIFEKSSFAVVKPPEQVEITNKQINNDLLFASKTFEVRVNQETGQISFYNPSGKLLISEFDGDGIFKPCKDSAENAYKVTQSFQLTAGEAIYGLGQHQTGKMNQRNQKIELKQNNMQTAIPYFYSTNGYGLFWDNTSTTIFDDKDNVTSFESEVGDCVDYYILCSNNADRGQFLWRDLTGQAPMYPRWVFGFWQSRERYKGQTELLDVVKKYRELKVPLDGIVQDWQYWGEDNTLWNSTEFGNPRFHNPKQMIDSVHDLNAHIIISVWPSFGKNTMIFNEMKQGGMLYDLITWPPIPEVQVYDPFNPRARDIYWSYMNKNIFSLGMDGWWLDATEPDQIKPKPTDELNKTYFGTLRKVRNAFPIQTTGGVYDHQRKETSDKRVFILTRSAFAGQQRYATTNWSGDVVSSWDLLHKQITNGLNMSFSGIPYWNSDIGGFFSWKNYQKGVSDPAFQELYVRWLQFATFCPMMRSHGTDTPREIYQFGKKGDWAYDAQEKFINLRYRLLPYIYSTAWKVTSEASTFMRALVMDFPDDNKVWDINNEYLFGSSILVCPITDSLYTSQKEKITSVHFDKVKSHTVYLPASIDWYDFWTGKKMIGGEEIQREAPIDLIPLYIKAGSIIPMGPFVQYTNEKDHSNIEIRIYPGANGQFTLYEDENDNYNYEKGVYSTVTFEWDDVSKKLTIADRKGEFPGMLKNRTFQVVLVSEKCGTGLQSTEKATKVVKYNGGSIEVKL